MIRACKLLLLCLSVQVFNPVFVFAQSDSATFKFGKITAADFDLSQHSFDTTADAVIIFKNGTVNITALMTRGQIISKRIKILTENGKKVANASIPLYGSQQIKYFKANSYNLEDGKIVTTAMSATDYHFDNESEFKDVIKFTVPNAKVGSIIDIEYATSISLPDWHFQDVHPVLSSTFTLQESLGSDFIPIEQSLINFHSRNKFNKDGSSYGVWVMKNLPAKIKEGLVFDPENFYSKIIFEVSGSNIYASWDAFSDFAIHSTQWYNSFYKKHSFFEKILPVIANESKEDAAKRIYYQRKKEGLPLSNTRMLLWIKKQDHAQN